MKQKLGPGLMNQNTHSYFTLNFVVPEVVITVSCPSLATTRFPPCATFSVPTSVQVEGPARTNLWRSMKLSSCRANVVFPNTVMVPWAKTPHNWKIYRLCQACSYHLVRNNTSLVYWFASNDFSLIQRSN